MPVGGPPELFTSAKRRPKAATVASTSRVMSSAFVMSATVNCASRPVAALISATAFCNSASRRPESITRAPSRANSSAAALPSPALDAQTRTGLSMSSRFITGAMLCERGKSVNRNSLPRWNHAPQHPAMNPQALLLLVASLAAARGAVWAMRTMARSTSAGRRRVAARGAASRAPGAGGGDGVVHVPRGRR